MNDPLAAPATPGRLRSLTEQGVLPPEALPRALEHSAHTPALAAWRAYLASVLLAAGVALFASGNLYAVAFNWHLVPRFGKVAFAAAWIVAGVAVALRTGVASPVGRVALTASATGVGALLAIIGQIYQTGADDWALFATWAVLILPWSVAARFPPLWVLNLAVLEVAVGFWGVQVSPETGDWNWLLLAAINGAAWAACARIPAPRWVPRLLAITTFLALLAPSLSTVLDHAWLEHVGGQVALAALLILAAWRMVVAQRDAAADRFPATVGALAVIIAADTLLGRLLFEGLEAEELGILVLSVIVLAEAVAFVAWIRQLPDQPDDEVHA